MSEVSLVDGHIYNGMSDEDIIKALECCSTTKLFRCCGCPCLVDSFGCNGIYMKKSALDLINRQKAEIERLVKEERALLITIEKMRNEIRRLQNILVNFMDEIYTFGNKNNIDTNCFAQIAVLGNEKDCVVKQIKSEAIKEFAERLKIFVIPQKADGYTREIVLKSNIDNLVKEMTESK